MKKGRLLLIGIIILLVLIIVVGRSRRQAKGDALQDAYSGVVSVKGLVVEPEPFTRYIEATGILSGNREAMVASETGGRVLRVNVDVGDFVAAGAPLIRLDDELYQLESERAKIAFDKVKMDLERIEKLYAQKSVSETDLENARLGAKGAEVQYRMALKTYNDATIRAPFSGTVAAKLTEVGQMIERGMPVVQLVDISSLKLTVPVSENDVIFLSLGAPATIVVDAVGDTVQGKVTAIGSRAATGSRTFPVELKLPGNDKLRSGMFARTIIASATTNDGYQLPRDAILPDAGRTIVFVAHGSIAEKIPVRVIGNSEERVAVEGLSPGDTVLTTGNQGLSQGSQISLMLAQRSRQ